MQHTDEYTVPGMLMAILILAVAGLLSMLGGLAFLMLGQMVARLP